MKLTFNGYTTPFDVSLVKSFSHILKDAPDEMRRVRVSGTLHVENIDDGPATELPQSEDEK